MSSAGRRITRPGSPVQASWNDDNLRRIFEELHPDQMHKFNVNAFRSAGNKLKKMVESDARSEGLGQQTSRTDEGWAWDTFGRIPRSIKVGKVWTGGMITSMRVFSARSRARGFLNSAPHTNIVVPGYKQKIPVPGSTAPAVPSGEVKSGRDIFGRANRSAPAEFRKALEASLNRMINRINRKYS